MAVDVRVQRSDSNLPKTLCWELLLGAFVGNFCWELLLGTFVGNFFDKSLILLIGVKR